MLWTIILVTVAITQTKDPVQNDDSWVMKVVGEAGQVTTTRGQLDLDLNSDQKKKIKAIGIALASSHKQELEKLNNGAPNKDAQKKFSELDSAKKKRVFEIQDSTQRSWDSELLKVLSTSQYIRYKQISIQGRGVMAFKRNDIIELLNMNEQQKKQALDIIIRTVGNIKATEAKFARKKDKPDERDFVNWEESIKQTNMITKTGVKECINLLNSLQRKKWEMMIGPIVDEYAERAEGN